MFCKYEKKDREQRYQREHERDRQRRPGGEQQHHEARQVAGEALVARLLGDQPQVLARRGDEHRADNKRREQNMCLDEHGNNYVLADYGDLKITYRHPLISFYPPGKFMIRLRPSSMFSTTVTRTRIPMTAA